MKKIICCIVLVLCVFLKISYATETDISTFLNETKQYTADFFPELNSQNLVDELTNGTKIDSKNLVNKVINIFIGKIKENAKIIFSIIAVSILCSILKNIQSSFGGNVSEIAFYVCYLFIIILIIASYTDIVSLCKDTITKLNDFMNMLIPLVLGLLVANGSIVSVSILQPILLVMTSTINVIVANVILPIIFISTMMNLIGNISENIKVSKIPKLLQKTCLWCLEFILIIFIGILSIEGTLGANVDGVTAKAAKSIVSTVIPVVGKALSDATDSILGATLITRNAVGIVGMIAIISIVLNPLISTLIMMITYNVASALIEPIVDSRISKCMSGMGDSIKIVFALMATVCMLFIISTTIMIKLGNFSV